MIVRSVIKLGNERETCQNIGGKNLTEDDAQNQKHVAPFWHPVDRILLNLSTLKHYKTDLKKVGVC